MMKPQIFLPRVESSLWRVGTFLHFSAILIFSSSVLHFRVTSKKQRSGAGPSELMDSSGSSLDLTAKIENLSRTSTGVAPPSPEIYRFLPVGPLSLIGVEEVASWRVKYHLPDDVIIRIPCLVDRVPDFEVDEVSEALEISPDQLNLPGRILIALQNLGDLEGLTIGVAAVLYSYAITP
ncbi:hypothetical protein Bca101_031720 [Brassica carinata]